MPTPAAVEPPTPENVQQSWGVIMFARIYKPAKTAMQSARAKTKEWVLEYEPATPQEIEPLMGWTSSDDMLSQVRCRSRSNPHCDRGAAWPRGRDADRARLQGSRHQPQADGSLSRPLHARSSKRSPASLYLLNESVHLRPDPLRPARDCYGAAPATVLETFTPGLLFA